MAHIATRCGEPAWYRSEMRHTDESREGVLIGRLPEAVLFRGDRDAILAAEPALGELPGAIDRLLASLARAKREAALITAPAPDQPEPPAEPTRHWTGKPWPVPRSAKSEALRDCGRDERAAIELLTNRLLTRAWREQELARMVRGGRSMTAARRALERRQSRSRSSGV